jgi:hypothetical protein
MEHHDFLRLISKMDIGLQVSLSESFNIVTADCIVKRVPVIVSEEISWVDDISKVMVDDSKIIAEKIKEFLKHPDRVINKNLRALRRYEIHALETWGEFLKNFEHHVSC